MYGKKVVIYFLLNTFVIIIYGPNPARAHDHSREHVGNVKGRQETIKEAQHLSSLAVLSESVFGMSSMCTRRARNVFFLFLFFEIPIES